LYEIRPGNGAESGVFFIPRARTGLTVGTQ